jgi:aminoglycoside/choline kinase family phosphotransferase
VPHSGLPAALYKDANIRNFILTQHGVAMVDFDDLTLAPFGYDLAKLIVTTAMTHGRSGAVDAALAAYNARVDTNACPPHRLHAYAEFHHTLTARYLGHNGYRHPWPLIRPWPVPTYQLRPGERSN